MKFMLFIRNVLIFLCLGYGFLDYPVLAQKSSVDAHKAFALYSKSRRGRVAWVQKASQQNGRLYHLSTGPKRFLIHSFLYLVSRVCPSFLISQFDWLYSYKTPR